MDTLVQDLRYTFRTLARTPGFTIFAILIVGLGIGASSTVFSVVNALLLRPLPFRDPGRLAWIANHDSTAMSGQTTQVGHFLDLRDASRSFSDMAAYMPFYDVGDAKLTGNGEPERLSEVPVSGNFFPLLGVEPEIGRNFTAEECLFNGPKAVLLSHGLWERRFASDRGILGRALTINDEPVTVVGVLPQSFDFSSVFNPGTHIDLYSAFPLTAETNRWGNTLAIIGRMKPGVTIAAAQSEVSTIAPQLTKAHPERNDFEGKVTPLSEHVRGRIRPALLVLTGAVGVVMLIVCANLSNLLLGRTAARQKEIAIRAALGAGQGRLVRQMLTESVVLSCCGAILGLLLAHLGTHALARLQAFSLPLLPNVRTDPVSLAFTAGIALVTGLLFGLAPAIQVPAAALHDALKDSSRGSTAGKKSGWVRGSLVISEIAFACALLVGAGLLIRSFLRVLDVDLGFHPERAAAVRVEPTWMKHPTRDQLNAYFDDVLRRARDIPGITAAGLADVLPLGRNRSWGAGVKGQFYERGHYPDAFVRVVSDGYLNSMGVPLRAGRDLTERDVPASEPVILINETMARNLFPQAPSPNDAALGQILRACGERRIVGIAGDVRHLALERGSGNEMYLPIRQCGDFSMIELVVRASLPPSSLASTVRAALLPVVPDLANSGFRNLQELVDRAVSPRRFVVLLLGGFAGFALLLASLGIYAVISYSVSQRTQEIGIRMALGASSRNVQGQVLRETLVLAAAGMALGAGGSWTLAQGLKSFLYGVTANDPITFIGMLVVLTAVAVMAGYLPARRASRIDPMVALRAS
jgi:predicted permease